MSVQDRIGNLAAWLETGDLMFVSTDLESLARAYEAAKDADPTEAAKVAVRIAEMVSGLCNDADMNAAKGAAR